MAMFIKATRDGQDTYLSFTGLSSEDIDDTLTANGYSTWVTVSEAEFLEHY